MFNVLGTGFGARFSNVERVRIDGGQLTTEQLRTIADSLLQAIERNSAERKIEPQAE